MPAVISHYLMAKRVLPRLEKQGIEVPDKEAFLLGAQGPDMLYFHRILPWQTGPSFAREGLRLHGERPAVLFDTMAKELNRAGAADEAVWRSYIYGYLCHYSLDRTAHPFVLYWQRVLQKRDPGYSANHSHYHYRVESALDTLALRHDTGLLIREFDLRHLAPPTTREQERSIGWLYNELLWDMFGVTAMPQQVALAVSDFRTVLFLVNDPQQYKRKAFVLPERLLGKGPMATSLLRPADTDDFDYANTAHHVWANIMDRDLKSHDSYFDLVIRSVDEACDMIAAFAAGQDALTVTGNRGFATDLDVDERHMKF